jgi:hypothetical protein
MQDRGFYTVEQAADTLDLTPGRIRQMLRAGEPLSVTDPQNTLRAARLPSVGLRGGSERSTQHGGVDEGDRRGVDRLTIHRLGCAV